MGNYRQVAQADSKYTEEVQPLYPNIAAPVLILWGEQDAWIPVDRAHTLHELIPESRLKTISDAGHLIIEEKPHALVGEIKGFLMGNA